MKWRLGAAALSSALAGLPSAAVANQLDSGAEGQALRLQIQAMQAQIDRLQEELDALKRQAGEALPAPEAASLVDERLAAAAAPEPEAADTGSAPAPEGIRIGGAVRFQYSRESYDRDNIRRRGDQDFDIFRLDLAGELGGVKLDAQWRWFQYMSAMHHAWVGYDFDAQSQLQLGLVRIPYGNQPFNSHSYFFSSNYYLGLEDTHAMGALFAHQGEAWNLQAGFFKNDSVGGVDGFVSDRTASYSYNVLGIRHPGEGIFDEPLHPAGAANSGALRLARSFGEPDAFSLELGASALYGNLHDAASRVGDYGAGGLPPNPQPGRWNIQAQAGQYDYRTQAGAERLAVGAYGFFDSIAARSDTWSFNLAWHLPVSWGPVSGLDFYNDHSRVTNKSGRLPPTWMNVTGIAVAAGGFYTYFDFVTARNQPFIGGSMAGDGGTEHRFNINVGFYF